MKILLILLNLHLFIYANFLNDNYNIYQAKQYYNNHNYKKAFNSFSKIENKTSKIYYNMANCLYKNNQYKKAILYYKKIDSDILNYEKSHNIANCYIKLNKPQKAIIFYKNALKFNTNKQTKFNLKLAKQLLKKQLEEEIKLKKQRKKIKTMKKNEGKDDGDKFIDDIKKKLTSDKLKKTPQIKSNNLSNLKSKNILQKIDIIKYKKTIKYKTQTKPIFSDLEEYKWDKKLKNRPINTLLIPLNLKGEQYDIKKPW